MDENNPLINVSMQIILHAGDARNNAFEAVNQAKTGNYEKADELMRKAEDDIRLAHQAQTEVLQKEMSGEAYNLCILFIHAQDTLMTIKTELNTCRELIELHHEINDLKAGR
jgi:PTS system cellobiose-specific IIA component